MKWILAAAALLFLLGGCVDSNGTARGVYVIADFPAREEAPYGELEWLIKDVVGRLEPGDAFALERIDLGLSEGLRLDGRPSRAVAQKRALLEQLDWLLSPSPVEAPGVGRDLVVAVDQGVGFLDSPGFGKRAVVLISDLRGARPTGLPTELDGYRFFAINASQWPGGASDTWAYLRRIDDWQRAVESRGGEWRVIGLERELTGTLLP